MNDLANPIYHTKDHLLFAYARWRCTEPIEIKFEHDKTVFVFEKNEEFDCILSDYFSKDTVVPLREYVDSVRGVRKEIFNHRAKAMAAK